MTEYDALEENNVKLHFFQVLVNGWKSKCPTWCFGIMATKINCLISSDFFENIWRTRRLQLLSVILMIFQGRFWHEGMLCAMIWLCWDRPFRTCSLAVSFESKLELNMLRMWAHYRTSDRKQSFQSWPKKTFLMCKDYLNLKSSILACHAK